jgi:hypothetical protein
VAATGAEINLETYGTLTDRLGRCFQRLGLRRQARDVGPTLGDLLQSDQQAQRRRSAEAAEDVS